MTTQQDIKMTTTKYEIFEGINGSGQTIYLVATVRKSDGAWMHTEQFTNKKEAETWVKFSM